MYSEQVVPQSKAVGYGKRFIYYTNMQLRQIYDGLRIPATFQETFKTRTFPKEIMEGVFQTNKIDDLSLTGSPQEKRSRRKSFDPSGELMMKKTTVLTGNHTRYRDRAGSTEEPLSL